MTAPAVAILLTLAAVAGVASAAPSAREQKLKTVRVKLPPRGELTLARFTLQVRRRDGRPVRRGLRIRLAGANAKKLPRSILAVGAIEESSSKPGRFSAIVAVANRRPLRSLSGRSVTPDQSELLIEVLLSLAGGSQPDEETVGPGSTGPSLLTRVIEAARRPDDEPPPQRFTRFLEPEDEARIAALLLTFEPADAARLDAGPPVSLSPLRLLKGYVGIAQAVVGDKPLNASFIRRFVDANFKAPGTKLALTPLLTWAARGGCTAGRRELETKRVTLPRGESTILTWIGRSDCADNFACGLNGQMTRDNRFGLPVHIAYTYTCADAHPGINGLACNTVPATAGCDVKVELFLKNEKR